VTQIQMDRQRAKIFEKMIDRDQKICLFPYVSKIFLSSVGKLRDTTHEDGALTKIMHAPDPVEKGGAAASQAFRRRTDA
jgi:hypothetical protein